MSTRLGPLWTVLALVAASCRGRDLAPPVARSSMNLQLDRVGSAVGAPRFTALGGRNGAAVTVAVIDAGFDLRHPMLRRRARWVLDHGAQPRAESAETAALEGRYRGAVWSGAAVERAIEQEISSGQRDPSLVEDPIGHGTFVASVAAGGALSPGFEGLAPGADLVLARVGSSDGIQDEAIIDALDFAIDRAGAQPLIVVLAAGSADGAHDGTSPLERAIDQRFLGQSRRMIVVAAGNDGGAETHRRAVVRRGEPAIALPFALRSSPASTRSFTVVHEGVVDLAIESEARERTRWVSSGEHPGAVIGAFRLGIDRSIAPPSVSGSQDALREGAIARVTIVTFESERSQGETSWRLLVRGEGTVDLYAAANVARFEGGDDRGTLVLPATAQSAVVVSALVTREQWPGVDGERDERIAQRFDGTPRFASLGPDRVHRARPELSAPGGWVLGARSGQCDPRAANSLCPESRSTNDQRTIAAAGTSVAAPVAAGALARLWSTRPELTPEALISRITAASDRWSPSRGWGAIDLAAALEDDPSPPVRCVMVPAVDEVRTGEPVTFSVRVFGARRSIAARPSLSVHVTGDDPSASPTFAVQAMEGGRAVIRARAPSRGATSVIAARAQTGAVECTASVRVRGLYEGGARPRAGCASSPGTHNQVSACMTAFACVCLSVRRGRRRRW
jgi:subtilisin family serine protease